jgi:glycosyl transferase, family 25
MQIHIINLARREDRRIKLIEELERHNITDYVFVDAVDGNTIDVNEMLSYGHSPLKKGEYGCYLSHLNIYKSILESSEDLHLILEDDIYFVKNFKNKLRKKLAKIEHVNWDIFYLGINDLQQKIKGKFISSIEGIYCPEKILWGTHAYLIKKDTVSKIMDSLTPIQLPIDHTLMLLDINRLTLVQTIVKTYNRDSDTA